MPGAANSSDAGHQDERKTMFHYSKYRHLDACDAMNYARTLAGIFDNTDELICEEIGDGNINYVFRVHRTNDERSVILKQADVMLRSSARPLDQDRIRIEAEALGIQARLAPGQVPIVHRFDADLALIVMEDIGDYPNLRHMLMTGRLPARLAQELTTFLVSTLLPTTDLVAERAVKRSQVRSFTNVELCDITEDLVLTEPYTNYRQRNQPSPCNESFVRNILYQNEPLWVDVASLRSAYINNTQALLHGDLHTGSIFADDRGIKVIDPEFACYGPIGYDIGNVIGNLAIALAHLRVRESHAEAEALRRVLLTLADDLIQRFSDHYDELVTNSLYRTSGFRKRWLHGVRSDSAGFAGTEMVRRAIGDARCVEVTSLDGDQRAAIERILIYQGVSLIQRRRSLSSGTDLVDLLDTCWRAVT